MLYIILMHNSCFIFDNDIIFYLLYIYFRLDKKQIFFFELKMAH